MASDRVPEPHPYLHEPLLYITNLPPNVTDEKLALAFQTCAPFRPNVNRDDGHGLLSGIIQFKFLDKAEKALATLQGCPIPEVIPPVYLTLSPYPPTNPPTPLPPSPVSAARTVKHLPHDYTDGQLFELFRPFGAISSARMHAVRSDRNAPPDALVEFWREEDAKAAVESMHYAEVGDQSISVQSYKPGRGASPVGRIGTTGFSPNAPAFVPSGSPVYGYPGQARQYSPPSRSPYNRPSNSFVHGPGQQVQLAAPGTSHSGLIDPCNLFCKNLDPEIDSNGLFSHFRTFGQIVSARVMRNEQGESRGFGFVSYQSPDQATAALHSMNGAVIGSKAIVVRLHEPKQLRQEKLAQRFASHGSNGHPRSHSGATSPTASEMGEWDTSGYSTFGSPRIPSSGLASPTALATHIINERPDRIRRGSGSYYQAALTGTLGMTMQYDELAGLSPVVRKEVLTGDLSRRLKAMDVVAANDVDAVVENLVGLSLSDVVAVIHDPKKLADTARSVQSTLHKEPSPSPSRNAPSPAASQDSRLLDPNTLNATASAPEHPSTPVSVAASLTTPPRTASPSGSVVPPQNERERMVLAVGKLEPKLKEELTELLMTLPKRERAMCLFNTDVLRAKIADAKMVLDSSEEDSGTIADSTQRTEQVKTPQTQPRKVSAESNEPRTPGLSSRATSGEASPPPKTPSAAGTTWTLAGLARLPAAEIVRLANSSSSTGLPLPKADPLVIKSTDEFIDGLLDKPVQQQKQLVGDKLFKVVKAFGIRGAPKLTIALLDQDDLRALAHLMNSYPSVLKEKALIVQQGVAAK